MEFSRTTAQAAVRQGLLDTSGSVVLLITGTGLKDPVAAARGVVLPLAVPAALGALRAHLRSKGR